MSPGLGGLDNLSKECSRAIWQGWTRRRSLTEATSGEYLVISSPLILESQPPKPMTCSKPTRPILMRLGSPQSNHTHRRFDGSSCALNTYGLVLKLCEFLVNPTPFLIGHLHALLENAIGAQKTEIAACNFLLVVRVLHDR